VIDRRDVGADHPAVRVDVGELRRVDERGGELAALALAAAVAHLIGEGAALRGAALLALPAALPATLLALPAILALALRADLLEQRHRLRPAEATRRELREVGSAVGRPCKERGELLLAELLGHADPHGILRRRTRRARGRQGGCRADEREPERDAEKR